MDFFEPHNCGEPAGRNLATDGEELARPLLVRNIPNLEKGMQDLNESVLVDCDQGELANDFGAPQNESSQGFENRESCVANGSRHGICIRTEGADCGEFMGGFGDRPFLREVLVERQRGITLVQDLGEE